MLTDIDLCVLKMKFFLTEQNISLTKEETYKLTDALLKFLNHQLSYQNAKDIFKSILHTNALFEIISKSPCQPLQQLNPQNISSSKKLRDDWSPYEKMRLSAAVILFEMHDWNSIASFVGTKTKHQCIITWERTLNPFIRKRKWEKDEDLMLLYLVSKYGTKNWKKVAREIGTRSDVQCRYHYHYIKNKGLPIPQEPLPGWS